MERSHRLRLNFIPLLSTCFLIIYFSAYVLSIPAILGIHPLDEKYFNSELIKCKDGSKIFNRDRINDNFCDCVDGTDEPGTSACPTGKFYCRNVGSMPRFLFSSRVNDRICDCCDGSDEYDGNIDCPNTCIMGGNVMYKANTYISKLKAPVDAKESKSRAKMEDLIQKLKGLKIVIILQVVVISCLVAFMILRRRVRFKRRRYR